MGGGRRRGARVADSGWSHEDGQGIEPGPRRPPVGSHNPSAGRAAQITGWSSSLFPNSYGGDKYMSENTIGRMLICLGYQHRQTLHGFRASARSLLSERGWCVFQLNCSASSPSRPLPFSYVDRGPTSTEHNTRRHGQRVQCSESGSGCLRATLRVLLTPPQVGLLCQAANHASALSVTGVRTAGLSANCSATSSLS